MNEQIEILRRELGKTLKLKHINTGAGMFYGRRNCDCCSIPTVYKVGEYNTVRYGKRDEYYIHIPNQAIWLGEVEIEEKNYMIFSINNELFAIYNKHNEGVGWVTSIYQIVKT